MTHDVQTDEGGTGMRQVGGRRGRAARFLGGVAVLALAGGAVAFGTWSAASDTAAPTTVAAQDVAVPPAATTLVCAGPLILPDDTGRGDAAFDPTPVDPVTSVAAVTDVPDDETAPDVAGGGVTTLDGATTRASLEPGGAGADVAQVTGPLVVNALPGASPARVGAVSAGLVTAGDLRGLSAASCAQPTADAWLVGGATDLTSTAQLVLDNAGSTPAEVTLELWGPSGRLDLSAERYLVAPGAERVVVLGGVAAEQRRIAVHVSTTGGRVAAHVQDSALDGFTPQGTDLVVPGTAPATRQVVPGVSVVASDVADERAPALRLLVPGDRPTTAHVQLLGPDGPVELPGAESVELAAGEVTDVPMGGLAAGAYTVVVDADEPVVAAAVVTRPGTAGDLDPTPPTERAWAAATTPGQGGMAVLPTGTTGTLVVGAVGADDDADGTAVATLRLLGAHGEVLGERSVRVPAGSTGAWPLADVAAGTGPLTPGVPASSAKAATSAVRAVDLVTGSGEVRLSWALVASVRRADGELLSVLDPVPVRSGPPSVAVREDPRLGTR